MLLITVSNNNYFLIKPFFNFQLFLAFDQIFIIFKGSNKRLQQHNHYKYVEYF